MSGMVLEEKKKDKFSSHEQYENTYDDREITSSGAYKVEEYDD